MKSPLLAAIVGALSLVATAAHAHAPHRGPAGHEGGAACDPVVLAAFAEVDDALRHLDDNIEGSRIKKSQKREFDQDLERAMERMQRARAIACRAARADVVVVETPRAPQIHVLDRASEDGLVSALSRASFEDERLAVLSLATRTVCVTSEQAKNLMAQMTFSRGRVDAARVLAPRVVDRDRVYLMLDALTFESDRREVRAILNETPAAADCRLPRS